MEKIREFTKKAMDGTIDEIRDERIVTMVLHNVGHIRAIGYINEWINEVGATEEVVIAKAIKTLYEVDEYIEKKDEYYLDLANRGELDFLPCEEYSIAEGKQCLFTEFLEELGVKPYKV